MSAHQDAVRREQRFQWSMIGLVAMVATASLSVLSGNVRFAAIGVRCLIALLSMVALGLSVSGLHHLVRCLRARQWLMTSDWLLFATLFGLLTIFVASLLFPAD